MAMTEDMGIWQKRKKYVMTICHENLKKNI